MEVVPLFWVGGLGFVVGFCGGDGVMGGRMEWRVGWMTRAGVQEGGGGWMEGWTDLLMQMPIAIPPPESKLQFLPVLVEGPPIRPPAEDV